MTRSAENWVVRHYITALAIAMVWPHYSEAVLIGSFPGLQELIDESDAIAILRIDEYVDPSSDSTLYTTHDCIIYQTLKGTIPTGGRIRLRLMDTRNLFESPFAMWSSHRMFLTKKRTADEPTKYRTIETVDANVRLGHLGHEKMPPGETVAEQVRTVINEAVAYLTARQHSENEFLKTMVVEPPADSCSLSIRPMATTP